MPGSSRRSRWSAALALCVVSSACREEAIDLSDPPDGPIGWYVVAHGTRGITAPVLIRLDGAEISSQPIGPNARSAYEGSGEPTFVEAVAPDGRTLVVSQGDALYVLSAADAFTPRRLPVERVEPRSSRVVVDSAWRQVAYASNEQVFVVDLDGATPARRLSFPDTRIGPIMFTGDGAHVLLGDSDQYAAAPSDGGVYRLLGPAEGRWTIGPYVLLDRGATFDLVDLRSSGAGITLDLGDATFGGFSADTYALFEVGRRTIGRVRLDGQDGGRFEILRTAAVDHELELAWLDGARMFVLDRDDADRFALFETPADEVDGTATQLTERGIEPFRVVAADDEAAYLCDSGLSRVERGRLAPVQPLVDNLVGGCRGGALTRTHVVFCGPRCGAVPKAGGDVVSVPSDAWIVPDGYVGSRDFSEQAVFVADDTGRAERVTPWGLWPSLSRRQGVLFILAGRTSHVYAVPLVPGGGAEGHFVLRGPGYLLGVHDDVAYFGREGALLAQPLDGSRADDPRVLTTTRTIGVLYGWTEGRLVVWSDGEFGLVDSEGDYETLASAPTWEAGFDARRERFFWSEGTELRTFQGGRATSVLDAGTRFTTVRFFDTGTDVLLSGAGLARIVSIAEPRGSTLPNETYLFAEPRFGELVTSGGYALGSSFADGIVRVSLDTGLSSSLVDDASGFAVASPPRVGVASRAGRLIGFSIDGTSRDLRVEGVRGHLRIAPEGGRVFFQRGDDEHFASLDVASGDVERLFDAVEINGLEPLPGGGFVVGRRGPSRGVEIERRDGTIAPLFEADDIDLMIVEVVPRYAD